MLRGGECRTCEAYFGSTNAWKCFFATYNWPILPVPTFFHEYLYDVANEVLPCACPPKESFQLSSTLISIRWGTRQVLVGQAVGNRHSSLTSTLCRSRCTQTHTVLGGVHNVRVHEFASGLVALTHLSSLKGPIMFLMQSRKQAASMKAIL